MPLLGGRSVSWSAYMTCNNSNLKLPFLATRCLYWGVDLPVDLPIWPVTIAIWNCHSWPLDASTRGVHLSVNLPIWPETIEIWNCHSWPLDASTGGGRSASWSAYMTCNNSNLKLPFLATRCLYLGWGDLSVNLPIWPVTIAIWNCHSWPLDASTGRLHLVGTCNNRSARLICLYDL